MVASANAHCQHRCPYHPSSFKNGRRECQLVIHYREPGRKLFLSFWVLLFGISWPEHLRHWKSLDLSSEAKSSTNGFLHFLVYIFTDIQKQHEDPSTAAPTLQKALFEESFLISLKMPNTEIVLTCWEMEENKRIDLLVVAYIHRS